MKIFNEFAKYFGSVYSKPLDIKHKILLAANLWNSKFLKNINYIFKLPVMFRTVYLHFESFCLPFNVNF